MQETTFEPNNDGQWPDDTIQNDTAVTTLDDDEITELCNQIKSSHVIESPGIPGASK